MPDFISHLNQSRHNEKCSSYLLINSEFRDWVITTTFYAAIHFTEAAFIAEYKAYKQAKLGQLEIESLHEKREKIVLNLFGKKCYRIYRKLRNACKTVRYIESFTDADEIPSNSYYKLSDVEQLINEYSVLKKEIQSQTTVNLIN